jgi:16S rRNA (cytosine967-C5)-methyltransferase
VRRRSPDKGDGEGQRAQPGSVARDLAHRVISAVLVDRTPLDQALSQALASPKFARLEARDRAFARSVATTALRRKGELDHVLNAYLERPLPAEPRHVRSILLAGAAQLICLGTSPHAAVGLSVEAVRRERGGARFAGLANAILRRVSAGAADLLGKEDATRLNIPDWLWKRWCAFYGEEVARRIAVASLREAPLDITIKRPGDVLLWAGRLGGKALGEATVRLAAQGRRVEELEAYAKGEWWVQDAGAALVARVAGPVAGKAVADLCAAPGGKTAQLVAAGGSVTAVDASQRRLERLSANMRRLRMEPEVVAANVLSWAPGRTFDVVVLDAPCSATGTIRRHPDILHLKQPGDIERHARQQAAMLASAAGLVKPGGLLVYSTCSLEPEEGEQHIEAFLGTNQAFAREAIAAEDIGGDSTWLTLRGDVRTLPYHLQLDTEAMSGIDGFYVARLRRNH